MSKQDFWDFFEIIMPLLLLFLFFIAIIAFLSFPVMQAQKAYNLACKDSGYVKNIYYDDAEYCLDVFGNAHHAVFNCQGYLFPECSAEIITIGTDRIMNIGDKNE